MVAFRVEMPHVGESVTEAVIGKWLVRPGDGVKKYDPLVEVVTDKVNMEVPAPADGTVTALLSEEGATIAMGSVIAEMDVASDAAPASSGESGGTGDAGGSGASPEADDADASRAGRIGTMLVGANVGPTGGEFRDTSLQSTDSTGKASSSEAGGASASGAAPSAGTDARRRYSPVVMRLAARHDVDLSQVDGTGRGGRVTKQDVEAFVGARGPTPASTSGQIDVGMRGDGASGTVRPSVAHAGGATVAVEREDEVVSPTPVRRMIADHMARSVREIPHAWAAVEVDVSDAVRFRDEHQSAITADTGQRLTYLPIALLLVARVLRQHRRLNASWTDDGVVLKGAVNVGIAVAADHGLVVPVVRDADRLDLRAAVLECTRLVDAARSNRLSVADVAGGTFTLNNTGAFGSMLGGAIINHPQAAILNTEAITRRPVVVSATDGSESIGIRPMMNLCLSFDHRVIDGAEAMAFLRDVKTALQSPSDGLRP